MIINTKQRNLFILQDATPQQQKSQPVNNSLPNNDNLQSQSKNFIAIERNQEKSSKIKEHESKIESLENEKKILMGQLKATQMIRDSLRKDLEKAKQDLVLLQICYDTQTSQINDP